MTNIIEKTKIAIDDLSVEIQEVDRKAIEVLRAACRLMIRRQSEAIRLKSLIPEGRMGEMAFLEVQVDQLVVDLAGLAGDIEANLGDVCDRLESAAKVVPIIRDDYAKITQAFADQLIEAQDKSEALTRALAARHKEHAPAGGLTRASVWAMTDGRCFYCDVELVREASFDAPGRLFHIDHIVARANGGPDHISNYVPACERCNGAKSSKSFVEFTRQKQAQLTVIEGGAAQSGGSK